MTVCVRASVPVCLCVLLCVRACFRRVRGIFACGTCVIKGKKWSAAYVTKKIASAATLIKLRRYKCRAHTYIHTHTQIHMLTLKVPHRHTHRQTHKQNHTYRYAQTNRNRSAHTYSHTQRQILSDTHEQILIQTQTGAQ